MDLLTHTPSNLRKEKIAIQPDAGFLRFAKCQEGEKYDRSKSEFQQKAIKIYVLEVLNLSKALQRAGRAANSLILRLDALCTYEVERPFHERADVVTSDCG